MLRKLEHHSSFRRIAIAQWKPTRDGLIYGHMAFDVTEALPFLAEQKAKHEQGISVGVLVGRAVAIGLAAMPELNARVIWDKIYVKDTVDVYFQVDIEGGGDLAGTLVQNADKKAHHTISRELRSKAKAIREGKDDQYEKTQKGGLFRKLPIPALRFLLRLYGWLLNNVGISAKLIGGNEDDPFGSVMVTNVGGFGIEIGYAPLVPWTRVPMVVTVSKPQETPVVRDGEIVIRTILNVSATFDHRVMDGAHLGKFTSIVRKHIEHPQELFEDA